MTDTPHLHALAMRTAALKVIDPGTGDFDMGLWFAVKALPLEADHAALVAEAVRLPEIAAMITLADHDRAMQAAVAKAVEAAVNAENEACAKMLDSEADDYEADASRFRGGTDPHHFRMNLASTARKYAAAIRLRGVAP